ncbi:penicillin-binding protein AmpH [Rhodopirellula maiorica SM1]|uniref:Beta-lactamase n=1 Tax=Rhodopirellula maiorica SM1 TaxID=1265738 RepID=M5S5S0_9BACT|nr:serine hydrolase domain-containing protein [Rhodopirellula maiorica]EMI23007.1 penicillin-binding protein AmpH [Rhodopirellula maiorica SM1]
MLRLFPAIFGRTFFAAIYVVCLSFEAIPEEPSGVGRLEQRVQKLAKTYIQSQSMMGVSIGVIQGAESATVHHGRTSEIGPPPNDQTLYEIGSISKVFTGILVADAVKRGEIRLDQPVSELLPTAVTMPSWPDRPITVLDIATHRSGLPRLGDNMPSLHTANPYGDYTSALAYEFLNSHSLSRAPGTQYEYSNLAFGLLGHLISRQTNKSYDELLQKRLTKPLGMPDTAVELAPAQKARLATPYDAEKQPTSNWSFADMPGAGGIRSTISDMMRFAKVHLQVPRNEIGSAIELAWKKHHVGDDSDNSMGLGWHLMGKGSTRIHSGQTGGYHSIILVNRDTQSAVVVLANTATDAVDALAIEVLELLQEN